MREFDLTKFVTTVNGFTKDDIVYLANHFIEMADYLHQAGYHINSTKCCEIAENLLDESDFINSLPVIIHKRG